MASDEWDMIVDVAAIVRRKRGELSTLVSLAE